MVDYAVEDEPLGTGGAIRNAANLLADGPDEPVLVLNGDVLDGHDLAAQVAQHTEARADATLYLTKVDDARAYGCVPTDASGRVSRLPREDAQPGDRTRSTPAVTSFGGR